jgi:hypothetical protein
LVVRQTYEGHREIEQLLHGLRQARSPEIQRRLIHPSARESADVLPQEESQPKAPRQAVETSR